MVTKRATYKMKGSDTVDAYATRIDPKRRKIFNAIRRLVRTSAPNLREGVRWGNPTYSGVRDLLWIYAYPKTNYVNFGFFHGANLKDPKKLLEGTGKGLRHIKVRGTTEISAPYYRNLIRQSVRRDSGAQ